MIRLRLLWYVIPGVIAFTIANRSFSILNPRKVDWLLNADPTVWNTDPFSSYIAWGFFRNTAIWQFPLGLNDSYGIGLNQSILNTSSIPLLAIPFKAINFLLPVHFQYFGFWIFICFVLQGYFALKIVEVWTDIRIQQILFAILIGISPVFIFRINWGHYELSAQWLLLACFYGVIARKSDRFFYILTIICISIDPYLTAMVLPIIVAHFLSTGIRSGIKIFQTILKIIKIVFIALAVMFILGYFQQIGSINSNGFGKFRFNLISFVLPYKDWSRIIPMQGVSEGDYEGYAFFGIAFFLLFVTIAIHKILHSGRRHAKLKITKSDIPFYLIGICYLVFASSTSIGWGDRNLFDYSQSSFGELLTNYAGQIFRSSGRFIWPLYYLSVFLIVKTSIKLKIETFLVAIFMMIQIVDSSEAYSQFHKFIESTNGRQPSLVSKSWNNFASGKEGFTVYPINNAAQHWDALSEYALNNNMTINVGYFGKMDDMLVNRSNARLKSILTRGNLDFQQVYVINDAKFYNKLCEADVVCLEIDGINLMKSKHGTLP